MPSLYSFSMDEIHQIAFISAHGWLLDYDGKWVKEGETQREHDPNHFGQYRLTNQWSLNDAYWQEREKQSVLPEFKFVLRDDLTSKSEFMPARVHDNDTGWDVSCAEPGGLILRPFDTAKIKLGFRSFCPPGYWLELKARSSTFVKKQLHSLYGTIDEAYEGEWVFACQYIPDQPNNAYKELRIEFGEKIAQIIPVRRQNMKVTQVTPGEFDRLCAERKGTRGTGGLGSTG